MPASITQHGQSTLSDGRVLVAGGYNNYVYTPVDNRWDVVAAASSSFGFRGQSTLNNGDVLVSGWGSAVIYRVDNNIWANATPVPVSFGFHKQSTLNDGCVMVSGGTTDGGGASNMLTTTYLYNATNNEWTGAAPLPISMRSHAQSTLNDGRVLVSGGYNAASGNLNNVYIYVPGGTWSPVASMNVKLSYHAQSTLADSRVLVSGGLNAFIYAANSNAWANISPLPTSIQYHGQSTLADGRVLVTGGTTGNTTYIYTPAGWVAVEEKVLYVFLYYDILHIN